jgi:hypothetical protein
MSEEEKTITIVLGQKGENITTKQIFIMDKENTITVLRQDIREIKLIFYLATVVLFLRLSYL